MILKDQIENLLTKATERRPSPMDLQRVVVARKPLTRMFADDGIVPNNPRWPLVVYRKAINLPTRGTDPAAVIDALFGQNGWGKSWRGSIYDFVHYHSQTHEVLGVARGDARVEFGGIKGRIMALKAGDIAILPAGIGHRLIEASKNFVVVGAYPSQGSYDECTDTRDRPKTVKSIAKVVKPDADPVYGKKGALLSVWKAKSSGRSP